MALSTSSTRLSTVVALVCVLCILLLGLKPGTSQERDVAKKFYSFAKPSSVEVIPPKQLELRALKNIASASDEVYRQAEEKGNLLMCYMKNPSSAGDLQKSRWNDFSQLKDWGWVENTRTNYLGETAPGLSELVGPKERTSSDKTFEVKHTGKTANENVKPGHEYPATNANYKNNIYPGKGVIVADWNWSPQGMINAESTTLGSKWDPKVDSPPKLAQWSDVMYLSWKQYTTPTQRSNLRYIFQHNVVNLPTQAVLARILKTQWPDDEHCKIGYAPAWPGKELTPDMDGFAALLGTPSVWGIPFMLIQHSGKEELGHLEVKKLTVTTEVLSERMYQPNIIVELGKVTSDT